MKEITLEEFFKIADKFFEWSLTLKNEDKEAKGAAMLGLLINSSINIPSLILDQPMTRKLCKEMLKLMGKDYSEYEEVYN